MSTEENLKEFYCQRHPDEPIKRIFIKDVTKPLMCMSCLIAREDNVDRSEVKTIKTFIDEIIANAEETSEFDINRQNYPSEISEILDSEDASIAKLAEHIEKEKQKVEDAYEQVKERVLLVLQKKRVELTSLLDAQLHVFKQNYKRMKNKVNKFFHGESENNFTTKSDLFAKMNSFSQTYELESFVSTILEELLENKVIFSQGKDYVEALKENIGAAAKQIKSQADHFPTSVLTNPSEFEKVAALLEKEMSKDLVQVNRIENPLIDIMISGGVFETEILKGNHKLVNTLKQWIVPEKNVKFKLLWRGSKDGWDWSQFYKKIGTAKPTLVLARVKGNKHIIGGYTDQPWTPATNTYKTSDYSFIFNLTENKKYRLKASSKNNAIYCAAGNGPTFGTGYDLYFAPGMNVNTSSYSYIGYTYEGSPDTSICGQTNFSVEEFEFFECEHRKLTEEDQSRFLSTESAPVDDYIEDDPGFDEF